jgi:methylase of polypeptide subunit release factors
MKSSHADRLLLHHAGSVETNELAKLTAALQRRFPDRVVEEVDERRLRQAIVRAATDRSSVSQHREPTIPEFRWPGQEHVEYLYLVLGWLGGTASKQVVEQAVKAAIDGVREWMGSRSQTSRKVIIYGPGEQVLAEVTVRPAQADRRENGSRWRRLAAWWRRRKATS